MKRIHNYILLSVLAFAAVSCIEEKFENDMPLAESGDEVQFGVSLGNPETRTVYGGESNNAFPIYWVNGDKVKIFSPHCLEGNRNAEYQVAVDGETQNYASSLTKTGSIGIQWGEGYSIEVNGEMVHNLHDFYSLYPTGDYELSTDGTKAEKIFINYSQNIVVDGASVKSDMEDCLMYARKEAVPRGQTVNLHYDPISTVFMVTLNVPSASVDDFIIQSISLTAPDNADGTAVNIAGTFSLKIDDGSFAEWGGSASNTVSAQLFDKNTGGYYTLKKGNSVTVPLFIVPVTGLNTNGWKIKVVANAKEYVKTLGSQDLVAGKIHKVTLPNLSTAAATEWDVSKWMTYIPRNVYLSEVSIPGSWNSINPDFQTTASTDDETIKKQYSQGVRAFHLDTRWKAEYSWGLFSKVVGLGVADGGDNGSATNAVFTSGDKYMRGSGTPLVEDIIKQLVGYIKETPQEYMILVCSFAQESINHKGGNGYWYEEISAICNKDAYKDYIVDAREVDSNTLVGDVLGKILVIVNMQEPISNTTTLPNGSRCMFTYMPSELTSTRFDSSSNETLLKNNSDNLWYSSTATTASGITMYNNQAQITSSTGSGISHNRGYAPSVTERSAVLNGILNWSKSNYGTENYAHDKWIYLGLGGYQVSSGGNAGAVSGSYSTIASTYNTWINGKVTEMGTTPSGQTTAVPYYPVGIVLMNYVNDYASTVKNILLLNNKYRLQYDSSKPSDYNPQALSLAEYGSTATTGGDAF